MSLPRAMRPLVQVWSYRNYAWFMGGMTPNLVTLWMQRIGISWLAWELTGSNAWVGATVAADYAPMMVLAPFVGAFVDRVNPVTVQKVAQWVTLVISLALGALTIAGFMNIWVLMALVLALGCTQPFNAVARHAIVPNTVSKEAIPTALACDSAIFNAARFVGPAIAGISIPFLGVGALFIANAVGCVSYLVGLYAMRLPLPEHARAKHAAGMKGILGEIREGIDYVRGHAGIGPIFLLMAIGSVWVRPLQDLLPGFSDQVFKAGPAGLGWLTASMGVGAMIAAMGVAMYGSTGGLTLILLTGFLLNILSTLGFVATANLWVALLMGAIWGFSLTLTTTATQAAVQSAVDPALRARVMSIYSVIYRGAPFLGALAIGAAADLIGLRLAFLIATSICVLPWLLTLAGRHRIMEAMEGGRSDLGVRVAAAARGFADMQFERITDLKRIADPSNLATRARDAGALGRAALARGSALLRHARVSDRAGAAVARSRMALAEVKSFWRDLRRR